MEGDNRAGRPVRSLRDGAATRHAPPPSSARAQARSGESPAARSRSSRCARRRPRRGGRRRRKRKREPRGREERHRQGERQRHHPALVHGGGHRAAGRLHFPCQFMPHRAPRRSVRAAVPRRVPRKGDIGGPQRLDSHLAVERDGRDRAADHRRRRGPSGWSGSPCWSARPCVTETESAGGGVEAGGGVVAGGAPSGPASWSFGVAGSGVGSAVVAELDVAGGDEGAGVDDVVPARGRLRRVGRRRRAAGGRRRRRGGRAGRLRR